MKKTILMTSSILTLIIIWYVVYIVVQSPMLMPSFLDVVKAFPKIIGDGGWIDLLMTLVRLVISFVLASLGGIILGFISAKYEMVEIWQRPIVTILRTIPVVSVIIILFILIGANIAPYIIVFLMIFPLFYQSTIDIIHRIDTSLIDVLTMNEGHFKESLKYVYIPILKNGLFVTMFQAFGLGVKVVVMSEYLMQTKHSIGKSIFMAKITLAYDQVYAWTIILILMTFLMEVIINKAKNKQKI